MVFCAVDLSAQTPDPPTSLTAVQENSVIRLQWNDPAVSPFNQPILSWNTSDVDTVGKSIGGVYPIFAGSRFDASNFNFQNHVGRKVKSVDLYADNPNDSCTFKLQIFRCTTWSNYDIRKVYEQPFSVIGTGHHTVVNLSSDFYITPEFIFYTFGYEVTNPNGGAVSVFGMDEGPHIYRRGDMVHTPNHYSGGWQSLYEVGGLFNVRVDANFIIKVTLSEKYNIYRNGEFLATVYEPAFTDSTAQPNQSYCYTVKTVFLNDLSAASNEACCTKTLNFNHPTQFNFTKADCQPTFTWLTVNEEEHDGLLDHYSIYKNDNLIGVTTDTFFVDNNASIGNFNYCLTASYLYDNQIYESESTCQTVAFSSPTITITGDSTICQNNTTTLTAISSESNYLWNNGSTDISIDVSPTTTSTYSVTTGNSDGCESTAFFTVQVFTLPNIILTPDTAICVGETLTLNASGGVQYLWNTGDTLSSITVAPLSTTIYSVSVINEHQCIANDSVTVTVHAFSEIVCSADTAICLNENATLSAIGNGTILWSNGSSQNTIMISPTETTTYFATLTNENNCSSIDSVVVTVLSLPEISISGDTVLCFNESTTLKATGGNSYLWSNGSSADSITITPTETTVYSVIATNEYQCEASQSISVTVLPPVEAYVIGDTTVCQGDSVTLTVVGGDNYLWDNGTMESQITVAPMVATTYHVTVFHQNGCFVELSHTISVLDLPQISITGDSSICWGDSTLLTVHGNYDFLWNTGSTDSSIWVSPTQTSGFSVIATNDHQCVVENNITIDVNPLPDVSIIGNDSICQNSSTTLVATGAESYIWNSGSTNDSIVVSPMQSTLYQVIGISSYGCSSNQDFEVRVQMLPSAHFVISGNSDVCQESVQNYSVLIDHAQNYVWSVPEGMTIEEGQGDFYITVFMSDTAQSDLISVFGSNECGHSDTVTMMLNVSYCSINITGNFQVCESSIQTYSVPENKENYFWEVSGGEILSGIGTNTIEVQWNNVGFGEIIADYQGAGMTSQIVSIYAQPDISIVGDTDICFGETTTLIASGGVDYSWNQSSTTPEITVSPEITTTYYVVVSNVYGCFSTDSIIVNVHALPEVHIEGDAEICSGESTTLTAIATSSVSYLWNDGSTTASITVSPTETTIYSVQIIDENGCINTAEIVVNVHALPEVYIEGNTEICSGETTTLSAITASSVSYLWNDGSTTDSITVSPTETTTYSVQITDENGCINTAEIVVNVHALPEVHIEGNTEICSGETTTLTAITTSSVSYLWNDGSTTDSITVSPTETTIYSVQITDENGCINIAEIVVNVHALPEVHIEGDTEICSGETTTLTAIATSSVSYLWNDGSTTASIAVLPTETTTYSVQITDENGCINIAEIVVNVHALPEVHIEGETEICSGETTTLTAITTSSVSYLWNDGSTTASIIVSPTETTTYSVQITDENGCINTAEIVVNVHALPEVHIEGDTEICSGETTTFTAITTSSVSYLWNDGSATASITVSPTETTTYSVQITDENGCINTAEIVVNVHALPEVYIEGDTEICSGESTTLTAIATSSVSYLWNDGSTTASITVSPTETTTYSVQITDENGCINTVEIVVNVHALPEIHIEGDAEICLGESTELEVLHADSIIVTYLWNTGETTQNIVVEPSINTEYIVTVTDEYGCVVSQSFTVEVVISTTPQDLTTISYSDYIQLSWIAPVEAEEYHIYRDSLLIATTSDAEFVDENVEPQVLYCYQVSTLVHACESEKTDQQCEIINDNHEILQESYIIQPNPAYDYCVVEGSSIICIEIINALGKKVFHCNYQAISQASIVTQSLESGIYFVRIQNLNGNWINKKLIIVH
ncbi:MAG: T9SS type A sorting domain-containing protein [Bacteroidales bacterium]|nr:T9SS type A sorting domain-containing protein [Bacteroidales bacterium]